MKVLNSLKSAKRRHKDCRVVRRKRRLYVINKTDPRFKARQGVAYPTLDRLMIADPDDMKPCPKDGKTMGEVMMRGNIVMKGYLKNKCLPGWLVPYRRSWRYAP